MLPVDAWTAIPCVVVRGRHALLLEERILRDSRTAPRHILANTAPPLALHLGPPALLSTAERHWLATASQREAAAPPRPSTADELPQWLVGPPYEAMPIPLPLGATDWMVAVPMAAPSAQPAPRAPASASHYWGRPTTAAGVAAMRKAEQAKAHAHARGAEEEEGGEEEAGWPGEQGSDEDLHLRALRSIYGPQAAAARSEASAAAARQRGRPSIFADARAPLPQARRVPFGPGF